MGEKEAAEPHQVTGAQAVGSGGHCLCPICSCTLRAEESRPHTVSQR